MKNKPADMNRRNFLAKTCAASGLVAFHPNLLWGQEQSVDDGVEKVLVIFKTHLDLGFTDLASAVIKTYVEQFIPRVLSLREQIEREHQPDRYVWTTGSWLIYRYLEEASPENRRRMERAILAGDLVWHGLPFSMETELMDRSVFRLGMAFSERLDRRFGRKTIAGKITDVPGHTRGIVPVMAEAGLELLHIGANDGSAELDVPPLFLWKSPEGSDLMVMYQHSYGGVAVLPGGRTAVSINFTWDNLGPHTAAEITKIYAVLRTRFPKAQVFASDLNALAAEVRSLRPRLPVVTQELGDTWLWATSSDPLLMARFREISRLRSEWIAQGRLSANDDVDLAFGKHFLCVPEHTFGTKAVHSHPDIYEMAAFRASRNLPEFRFMEQSWADKRANIDRAGGALPAELAAEAGARLKSLSPVRTERDRLRKLDSPSEKLETKHFRIGFDEKTGAIRFLEHRASRRQWAGSAHSLGLLSYQTFSPPDFNRFLDQYVMPKLRNKDWCLNAWSKPGLEKTHAQSALFFTTLKQLWHEQRLDGHFFLADLEVRDAGDSGCPREIIVETFVPDSEPTLRLTLKWFNKPASRLPEALWFSFTPPISRDGRFEMDKMGQAISPLEVAKGGNRSLHVVIRGVSYHDQRGGFQLETLDAFLLSPGRRSLLTFDYQQPDMAGGLHFCLFNNTKSTNYRTWFEDDMQFRFNLLF
ncbi:MAG: DUF5054 domain-containing protein [Verrucomicrobiota bacterium]